MYENVLNASAPTITATITFTDASTQVIPGNVIVNWFTAPAAGNLAYNGNMQRTSNTAPGALSTCHTTGPILFEMGLTISGANQSRGPAGSSRTRKFAQAGVRGPALAAGFA